jgi:hypothetical protein
MTVPPCAMISATSPLANKTTPRQATVNHTLAFGHGDGRGSMITRGLADHHA